MDSVSDKEVGEIWDRMKKDVNVSELKKQKTMPDFVSQLKKEMESISKNEKQVKRLLKKGFAERFSELPEAKGFYEIRETMVKPVFKLKVPVPVPKLPERIAGRKGGNKISIKSKGRFRTFNVNNVKITEYSWRGKPAVSFYSLKQNKLITWGLKNG